MSEEIVAGHPAIRNRPTGSGTIKRTMPWSEKMDAWLAEHPEMADNYDFRQDPRLAEFERGEQRTLLPKEAPKKGETRFFCWEYDGAINTRLHWLNEPDIRPWGGGTGLSNIKETPRFLQENENVRVGDMLDRYSGAVYVISQSMRDLIGEYAEGSVDIIDCIWEFKNKNVEPQKRYLMDVIKGHKIVDRLRSKCVYGTEYHSGEIIYSYTESVSLANIDHSGIHICRDLEDNGRLGDRVYFSNEIAFEIRHRGIKGQSFNDIAHNSYPVLTDWFVAEWLR